MKATGDLKINQPFDPAAIAGTRVDVNEFAHLIVAINRWDKFLDRVFLVPINGKLTEEVLEKLSLEDSQYYLDLQIQLSQCLSKVENDKLMGSLEEICRSIKKESYKLISTTLKNLVDNKHSLLELGHKDEHLTSSGTNSPRKTLVGQPDLEVSLEYKDCLLEQRKQLKLEIAGQKSEIKSQITRLKTALRTNFYTAS